jgi:type II secretion system protein H
VRHPASGGFTLIEVVVVLVIMGITMAAVVPAFANHSMTSAKESGETAITHLLATCRATAIEKGSSVRLILDPAHARYWVWERKSASVNAFSIDVLVRDDTIPLPSGTTLLPNPRRPTPRAYFQFALDGSARGDTIAVQRNGQTTTFAINTWTGDVMTVSP